MWWQTLYPVKVNDPRAFRLPIRSHRSPSKFKVSSALDKNEKTGNEINRLKKRKTHTDEGAETGNRKD